MPTYKIERDGETTRLISKKYRVEAKRLKGHVWVKVTANTYAHGKRFTKQGLTNIHDAVTPFEMRVILLHFARIARQYAKNGPTLRYTNYAEIFGSCFD